jgi:hypothetical protein
MYENGLSPADLRAVIGGNCNNGGSFLGGGNFFEAIIALAVLAMFTGNGNGGGIFGGGNNNICREAVDQQTLIGKLDGITNGKIELYEDGGLTKKITDLTKVPVGEIYMVMVPNAGYQYKADSLKITDSAYAAVEATLVGGDYKVTVPVGGLTVKAEFEVASYKLALSLQYPEWAGLSQIKVGNGENKAVNDGTWLEVPYNSDVTITAKDANLHKVVKAIDKTGSLGTINASNNAVTFKMPAANTTLAVEVAVK